MIAFSRFTRSRSRAASGLIAAGSGMVKVTTVQPARRASPKTITCSARTASKSQRGPITSFIAAEDGHQVGPHGQRVVELAGPDLVHPQPTDGQVGVLQRLVLSVGDVLGQPVRPAA